LSIPKERGRQLSVAEERATLMGLANLHEKKGKGFKRVANTHFRT